MKTFAKGARPLASAMAATLALVATVLPAAPAAAAVTSTHYQKSVNVACPTDFCSATFPKLAANRWLDIDHVSCEVRGTDVQVALLMTADGNFQYPLPLQWQHADGAIKIVTVGGDVNIRVPPGKQVLASFYIVGSKDGYCAITGTLHTSS